MRKKLFAHILFIFGFFLVAPLVGRVFAATLLFDPSSVSKTVGQTFELKANVNAGADEITSTDMYILYDANLLEATAVNAGTFFPTVLKDMTRAGKVYVAGMVDDPTATKTGAGTVATIVFKAKSNGSTTVRFECTQGLTTDSNVTKNDLNATDVIVCSANGIATITIGGGVGPTATPTPTPAPAAQATQVSTTVPTATPTSAQAAQAAQVPSQLPKSGFFDTVVKYSVPGAVLLFLGGVVRLLL